MFVYGIIKSFFIFTSLSVFIGCPRCFKLMYSIAVREQEQAFQAFERAFEAPTLQEGFAQVLSVHRSVCPSVFSG
jgi:hypothetical protein